MFTNDDPEMQEKIRAVLKSQLVSTYGSDYLSPDASKEKASRLRAEYGAESAAAAAEAEGRGQSGISSTKQTDYKAHGNRPAELVNSSTRYGARDVQVPKYQSGVLPPEALNNTFLGPNAHQTQTTYKTEISDPGQGRMGGSHGTGEPDLIRWRHPQWEGPVGPSAK